MLIPIYIQPIARHYILSPCSCLYSLVCMYMDSYIYLVVWSIYIAIWPEYSYGLNEPTIYTSVISCVQYVDGTIIRTIRVWLHYMHIRIWCVPYVYSINMHMVQNINTVVM